MQVFSSGGRRGTLAVVTRLLVQRLVCFAGLPLAVMSACGRCQSGEGNVAPATDATPSGIPDDIVTNLLDSIMNDPEIRLAPGAVVFCGKAGFPQVFDALDGCHYPVPFAEISAILRPESPLAFLWSGDGGAGP